MCDPVSMVVGAVGGMVASKALAPKQKAQAATSEAAADPAAERAAAEAQAQQTANRRLAEDQRRRREQQSLLAKGAPQPSFGDATAGADPINPMGTSNRSTTARSGSLMSRVANQVASSSSAVAPTAYGGGGSRMQVNML